MIRPPTFPVFLGLVMSSSSSCLKLRSSPPLFFFCLHTSNFARPVPPTVKVAPLPPRRSPLGWSLSTEPPLYLREGHWRQPHNNLQIHLNTVPPPPPPTIICRSMRQRRRTVLGLCHHLSPPPPLTSSSSHPYFFPVAPPI
jgi:hypothetical protein